MLPIFRTLLTRSALSLLVSFSILHPALSHAQEVLRIGGTGTALGTMNLLIAAYQKRHPNITIKLMPSVGSSGAIKAVVQDALDIGLIGRPLREDERKPGLKVIEYARTPFIFAAGKHVPVTGLSSKELIRIYNGEMLTWPNGERIRIVLRPTTDADTIIAKQISAEMSAAVDAALSRQGMLMAMTNQECHDMIEKTPGSLGFSSLTQLMAEPQALKQLSHNGVAPTTGNLETGSYPLSKPLFLIMKPAPSALVRRFIEFIGSAEGRAILEKSGNVPLRIPTR